MRLLLLGTPLVMLGACESNASANKDTSGTNSTVSACDISPEACDEDGDGYKPSEGDCDDNDDSVNPSVVETCNGRDDDCDGEIDEGVGSSWYEDSDGDGFGDRSAGTIACEQPDGYVSNSSDCNDDEARSFPGNPESCDGIDNNCDGVIDEGVTTRYYADADADNYGDAASYVDACAQPSGYVEDSTDCDDGNENAFPDNPEVCDQIDNDCDGKVDEGVTTTYYADIDGDGYGDVLAPEEACALPTGYAANPDDCDDTNADVSPAGTELCNGIDDDCDGVIDENDAADASTWYADADGDGYGDGANSTVSCTAPAGYVADGTDCDDTRDLSNPGATEYCNGYDDNCDGRVDEDTAVDATTWYADIDGDGYGNGAASDVECTAPAGYVADSTDCDDRDATSHPGGIEVCDGADNDCNGLVDDAPTDGTTYYADDDGDGFGDAGNTVSECALPSGYVENAHDCNDSNGDEPVLADAISGSPSGDGSVSAPYDAIQDAIDAASECVIAYAGTYTEQIDLGGKSLDVWGVGGADNTTIDASLSVCSSTNPTACGTAVDISSGGGATPTLRGFTITGGTGAVTSSTSSETCADSSASHTGANTCTVTTYTYCGGGIFVSGDDPTFEDIMVTANTLPVAEQASTGDFTQAWLYSYGGGICVIDGNVTASDTWVTNNYADTGGGVYVGGGGLLSFEQGLVGGNDASDGGAIAVSDSSLTSNNSIWACNDASTDGGGVFLEGSASARLENVVLFGNTSSTSGSARGADVWGSSASTFVMLNSIIQNNVATALLYGTGSATMSYNDVHNAAGAGTYNGTWAAGAGSISVGSNFIAAACDGNPRNDDFTLAGSSSAFDAGNPAAAYDDVNGSQNDMGAYGGPQGSW